MYQYTTPGKYNVQLLIRTLQGCERTIYDSITIYDKPPLTTTSDTPLCHKDAVQLHAQSIVNGNYAWTPNNYFITGANTATPTVNPDIDTALHCNLHRPNRLREQQTCSHRRERYIVGIRAGRTAPSVPVIRYCSKHGQTEPMPLRGMISAMVSIISNNSEVLVTPPAPAASYAIQVTLGSCSSRDAVNYRVVDPPNAYAGEDTTICYGDRVTLRASGGSFYTWTPR